MRFTLLSRSNIVSNVFIDFNIITLQMLLVVYFETLIKTQIPSIAKALSLYLLCHAVKIDKRWIYLFPKYYYKYKSGEKVVFDKTQVEQICPKGGT